MRLPRKRNKKTANGRKNKNTGCIISTMLVYLAIENSSGWNDFWNFWSWSGNQTGRFGIALGSLLARSPKVSTILHHIPFRSPVPVLPFFVSFCVIALCYLSNKETYFQEHSSVSFIQKLLIQVKTQFKCCSSYLFRSTHLLYAPLDINVLNSLPPSQNYYLKQWRGFLGCWSSDLHFLQQHTFSKPYRHYSQYENIHVCICKNLNSNKITQL